MSLGIEIVRDPAAPDDTAVFIAALATGRSVLVPAGLWTIALGALPPLVKGQRIIGEGQGLTTLRFFGEGDAVVLCNQVDASGGHNARHLSGIENVSIQGHTADPDSMGIRMTGGVGCGVRNVSICGFGHDVVLDGTNCARIENLEIGGDDIPGHTYIVPQHGIWFTEGAEAGRGWTVENGTNGNTIVGLFMNQGGPAPVQMAGANNVVRGFASNAGGFRLRGNANRFADGVFEYAHDSVAAFISEGVSVVGWMLNLDNIDTGVNSLLHVGPGSVIYGLTADNCKVNGRHFVDCSDQANLAGYARLTGVHECSLSPATRAVSIEQIYSEASFFQVFEPSLTYADGRGSVGIGKLQPTNARLHVASEGYIPKVISAQWGAAPPGWEWP